MKSSVFKLSKYLFGDKTVQKKDMIRKFVCTTDAEFGEKKMCCMLQFTLLMC